MEIKSYRVINRKLARQLANQLNISIESETVTESEFKGGFSGFGATRRKSQKRFARKLDDPRLLEEIVEGLRDCGQLKIYRPERMRELPDRATFVREIGVDGTPVVLPVKGQSPSLPDIPQITVWIFEPLGQNLGFIDAEPDGSWAWDWIGTYLFLVEEPFEEPETRYLYSGISALRLLAGDLAGHDPEIRSGSGRGRDIYGRDDFTHPIEKLCRVGGVPLRKRPVEIVYRIAAMTNEQATTINEHRLRLNDILAYPLYIADLL